MVSERNRILNIIEYIESCGVNINVNKNKAQGKKGFFKVKNNSFRIDIAKKQTNNEILRILAHEFAHYIHYTFDKKLEKLDFIFTNNNDTLQEELIEITVSLISKKEIQPLFDQQKDVQRDIKRFLLEIALIYPNIEKKEFSKIIEAKINKKPYKYLLKYDSVKVLSGLTSKIYSIKNIEDDNDIKLYLELKSKERLLKRIKNRISKLNKYYNTPTELFARTFELYTTDKEKLKKIAPNIYNDYEECITNNKIPLITNFIKFYL